MASIKTIYECPHCHETLTASRRPEKCPNPKCGYDFGEALMEYKYPVTLQEQFERMKSKHAHLDSVIAMPIEKSMFMMNDALNIIETVSAKNVPASDIRSLVTMAMRIGNIATKYNEYIEAGGRHVPALFIKEGDKNEQLPKKPDGEGPS
jgi:hypothetical protein